MKKRIKNLWVEALRSKAYRQGTSGLRFEDTFCCLGVLCDLHAKAAFVSWDYDDKASLYTYLGESIVLPQAVCEWAGLDGSNPSVPAISLTTHNDTRRRSFRRLATLIERHL